MKKTAPLFVFFIAFVHIALGQSVLYTGSVLDSLARPIKGAAIYRVTDAIWQEYPSRGNPPQFVLTDDQGVYRIQLNDKDLLQLWEAPVEKPRNFKIFQFRYDPFDDAGQLYAMQASAAVYHQLDFNGDSLNYPRGLPIERTGSSGEYRSVRYTNGKYQLHRSTTPDFATVGINLSLSGYLTHAIDRMKLQKTYRQGYAQDGQLQDAYTPFSWGPAVVPEIPTYENKIFQTGYHHSTAVDITYHRESFGTLAYIWDYKKTQGIFAKNSTKALYTRLNYKKKISDISDIQGALIFHQTNEKFPLIGNNHATLLMGALLQPINMRANESQIPPDELDNPWYIQQQQNDHANSKKYAGYLTYKKIDKEKWELKTNVNLQYDNNIARFGRNTLRTAPDNYTYFDRQLTTRQLSSHVLSAYHLSEEVKISANAQWNIQKLALDKDRFTNTRDQFPQSGSVQKLYNDKLHHYAVDMQAGLSYKIAEYRDYVEIGFLNGLLISDKSKQRSAYNLQAEISGLKDLDDLGLYGAKVKIWAKSQIAHTEPLQIQNDMQFSTLHESIGNFQDYLPAHELLLWKPVDRLQRKINFEFGTETTIKYRHHIGLNFYSFRVENAYVPIFENEAYAWQNAINYKQDGWKAWVSSYVGAHDRIQWNYNLTWQSYRNKTSKLLIGSERIPMAGFREISKNYIAGQPVGVLVGSAYKRDPSGHLIMGSDGYPLVDEQLRILGDPNPDFKLLFHNNIRRRSYQISINFEWSQGGQIWNGTQQTLNYYGRSVETAAQRNTVNYIYDGVNTLGHPNTVPVAFYDLDQDIDQNRWVRYGRTGVAEDAIEDASYFSLSHLTLSKKINIKSRHLNEIQIGLFVENLLFLSSYKGYAPTSALLGQSTAIGLDYFNSPMRRTYGFNLKFAL